jgi:hypothetical protein
MRDKSLLNVPVTEKPHEPSGNESEENKLFEDLLFLKFFGSLKIQTCFQRKALIATDNRHIKFKMKRVKSIY